MACFSIHSLSECIKVASAVCQPDAKISDFQTIAHGETIVKTIDLKGFSTRFARIFPKVIAVLSVNSKPLNHLFYFGDQPPIFQDRTQYDLNIPIDVGVLP